MFQVHAVLVFSEVKSYSDGTVGAWEGRHLVGWALDTSHPFLS